MGLLFGSTGAHTYLKSGQVAPSPPLDNKLTQLLITRPVAGPSTPLTFLHISRIRGSWLSDKIIPTYNFSASHLCQTFSKLLIGDSNCDDLPDQDKNSIVAKLRGFYRQYQFKQLIKQPTRTTNKSSTLLDHFASNKPNFIISSGSKTIGFSDHDLIYGMRKYQVVCEKNLKSLKAGTLNTIPPNYLKKPYLTLPGIIF